MGGKVVRPSAVGDIVKRYRAGVQAVALARKHKCTKQTVHNILRRNGVQVRPPDVSRREPLSPYLASIGEQFRLARRKQGVTVKGMALLLRCSINTVRWHEMGVRMFRLDRFVRAAALLKVTPSELIRPAPYRGRRV